MSTLKKNSLWVLLAAVCLIFLVSFPVFAAELTTEIQSPVDGILRGYIRDDSDWDRLVSGTIRVSDAASGAVLTEVSFTADQFNETYSRRFGDGWHYFETALDPALTAGKTLSYEILTESATVPVAAETRTQPSSEQPAVTEQSASSEQGPGTKAEEPVQVEETYIADEVEYRKGSYQGSFRLVGYYGHGTTYSGAPTRSDHTVAADLSVLPLGTKIILNDIVYTVEDIGSAVQGQMIDIYFDTWEEAYAVTENGWQYADVWLAEPLT